MLVVNVHSASSTQLSPWCSISNSRILSFDDLKCYRRLRVNERRLKITFYSMSDFDVTE